MGATELLKTTLHLVETEVDQAGAVQTLLDLGATPAVIRQVQTRLLDGLSRNPLFDRTGIVAARLLWATLDRAEQLASTPPLARAA